MITFQSRSRLKLPWLLSRSKPKTETGKVPLLPDARNKVFIKFDEKKKANTLPNNFSLILHKHQMMTCSCVIEG